MAITFCCAKPVQKTCEPFKKNVMSANAPRSWAVAASPTAARGRGGAGGDGPAPGRVRPAGAAAARRGAALRGARGAVGAGVAVRGNGELTAAARLGARRARLRPRCPDGALGMLLLVHG